MPRKLNKKRIGKLIERIVIFVSSASVLTFLYLLSQKNHVTKTYLQGSSQCVPGSDVRCLSIWINYYDNFMHSFIWSAVIAVGLPIIFFGGRALFNYLVTEVEE